MIARMHAASSSPSIQGQLLRVSEHRAVAIYLRKGRTWVADFVDGQGVLIDVNTWFRFNCGSLANPYVSRRIALESALPLPEELVVKIEALHRANQLLGPRKRPPWMSVLFPLLPRTRWRC